VKGAKAKPRQENASPDDEALLRAKYLDYCSAQVADLLLYLSPDEIFVLAERAGREMGEAPRPSYTRMVEVATRWLSTRVALPPFEVWIEDYRAHPDRYESYLMGLWEADMKVPLDG
jgi:hypothetical protein